MKDAAPAESVIVEMGAPLRKPLLPHDVTLDAVLSLSLLAQAGMLARLGVTLGTADAFDSATALMPVLPSNILGCFIMGALCDGKTVASVLRSAGAPANGKTMDAVSAEPLPLVPKLTAAWAPLLLGLRTGFCGSLTSYSTWNQVTAKYYIINKPLP
jgi:fluoride ion exporter CrcB/FEX